MAGNPQLRTDAFTEFVKEVESRLQHALIARYGLQVGRESAAEALAYAWEHWDRVQQMTNPAGYLFRVGTSRSRRLRRSTRVLPEVSVDGARWVEPGLPSALRRLSPQTEDCGPPGAQFRVHPRRSRRCDGDRCRKSSQAPVAGDGEAEKRFGGR